MKAVIKLLVAAMVLMAVVGCGKKESTGGDSAKKTKAKTFSAAEVSTELTKLFGTTKAWQPEFLTKVKYGMGYDELAKIFPGLGKPDEYGFSEGPLKSSPITSLIEIRYDDAGKATDVTIFFKSDLGIKKDELRKLIKDAIVAKWGKESGDEDNIATWVNDSFDTIQLTFDVMDECWEFEIDLEEK